MGPSGRIPLIHETHGKAGAFLELAGNVTRLKRPWSVVAIGVQR